jgi:cytochrome c-type biogenesis protein CcmH
MTAGDTDAQAIAYIVSRYGDFVLLQPPMKPATYALWFAPPLLLAGVAVGVGAAIRRRAATRAPAETPLDSAERARLARLMQESE